jgi:hypothetical protein
VETTIEWVDARERLPYDGAGIVAAVTGRYPTDPRDDDPDDDPDSLSGQDFWLVLPMYFRRIHPVEDTGEIIENCFFDSDGVVRLPVGGTTDEVVTHWTEMPNLPGADTNRIIGDGVRPALRAVSVD